MRMIQSPIGFNQSTPLGQGIRRYDPGRLGTCDPVAQGGTSMQSLTYFQSPDVTKVDDSKCPRDSLFAKAALVDHPP